MSLPGFHLVPVRETRGLHPNHPRAPERRLSRWQVSWVMRDHPRYDGFGGQAFDPMAYQAKLILRAALADLREDA